VTRFYYSETGPDADRAELERQFHRVGEYANDQDIAVGNTAGREETMKNYRDTTPGPWFYSSGAVWADKDEKIGVAMRIIDSPVRPYQRDNNMRLIASAPDLLAALIALSEAGRGIEESWEKNLSAAARELSAACDDAEVVIAKAKGEA
jgi:hypothetical protein